jgi:hypothetical protein
VFVVGRRSSVVSVKHALWRGRVISHWGNATFPGFGYGRRVYCFSGILISIWIGTLIWTDDDDDYHPPPTCRHTNLSTTKHQTFQTFHPSSPIQTLTPPPQSSGAASTRTENVVAFYKSLPKGPSEHKAGGLRGRYFEGKNASG